MPIDLRLTLCADGKYLKRCGRRDSRQYDDLDLTWGFCAAGGTAITRRNFLRTYGFR